jgi:type IV pilus assembly protein PilW
MTTRSDYRSARRNRLRGMSLIETMVGMTLGILVSLIITQVWGVFENQKQRTVSATAGQATGLLALTELEQDVRSAGAGLTDTAMFNCGTIFSYYENGGTQISPVPAYAGAMGLAPVQIVDGGAATASDTIIVKRGSDFLGAIPATLTANMPSPSAELNISTTSGFADGNVVLLVGASGNCTVTQVTQVQAAAAKLQHNPGGGVTYNPAASFQAAPTALPLPPPPAPAPVLTPWPAYQTGDRVIKIGQMVSRSYTVNGANELTVRDDSVPTTSTTSSLASDIVMFKAQYGIADAGSQNVNAWVSATAASGWNVLNATLLRRIKAVRVVIVARSAKMEAPGTTTVAPVAWPDAASPVIDLSANPDWQRYRYRTYQLVIPIRNMIWANV